MVSSNFIKGIFVGSILFLASFVFANTVQASPLHEATFAGDVELVRLLIENGADVDDRDVQGVTPLNLAIRAGHADIARVLIANGADVNARPASDGGETVVPLDVSIYLERGVGRPHGRDRGRKGSDRPAHSSFPKHAKPEKFLPGHIPFGLDPNYR